VPAKGYYNRVQVVNGGRKMHFGNADVFLDHVWRWSLYSHGARIRAVRLYISYGRATAATIRELGYPSAPCCVLGIVSSSNPMIFIKTTVTRPSTRTSRSSEQ
jgi:hypothetical protein